MELTPRSKFTPDMSPPLSMQHSASSCSSSCGGVSSVGNGGCGYIEHTVSKFDTLAGVAIKYGVEVADIKRMNGLTSDLQMFALKSLQIPLPGRHPPSPVMSNGYDAQGRTSSEMTPVNRRYSDSFDSIKSLKLSSSRRHISPSINTLRGYYGLTATNDRNGVGEGFEMTQITNTPLGLHRKSKSEASGVSEMCNMDNVAVDKSVEKLARRRQSEVGLKQHTLEIVLKQDNTSSNGVFSAAAGKGLALRPKAANRSTPEAEAGSTNTSFLGSRDSLMAESFTGVKKSSSAPSFQQSDNNGSSSSSIWPTSVLNLTADLQALSTAAITRPIFDGLPKPISGRKNKTAVD